MNRPCRWLRRCGWLWVFAGSGAEMPIRWAIPFPFFLMGNFVTPLLRPIFIPWAALRVARRRSRPAGLAVLVVGVPASGGSPTNW